MDTPKFVAFHVTGAGQGYSVRVFGLDADGVIWVWRDQAEQWTPLKNRMPKEAK